MKIFTNLSLVDHAREIHSIYGATDLWTYIGNAVGASPCQEWSMKLKKDIESPKKNKVLEDLRR